MLTISEAIARYEVKPPRGRKAAKACYRCKQTLQESRTGNRATGYGAACSDCYYEEVGELIEKHPIASARAPRG